MSVFGWDYPAGAEHDPRAPWNQDEVPETCEECGALPVGHDLIEVSSAERRGGVEYLCEACAGWEECDRCENLEPDMPFGICEDCELELLEREEDEAGEDV